MNHAANAKNLSSQMQEDISIIFAHLNKLHNDQYITFQTSGEPPTLDTDFFFSPKAFEIMNLFSIQQEQERRVIHPGTTID